jgi:hypothetical protein
MVPSQLYASSHVFRVKRSHEAVIMRCWAGVQIVRAHPQGSSTHIWRSIRTFKKVTISQVSHISKTAPLRNSGRPENAMKRMVASLGGSVIPRTQWDQSQASLEDCSLGTKISIINVLFYEKLSEIKLKRTDTTLDLSQ